MSSRRMNHKRYCLIGEPTDLFPEVTFGATGTPTLVTAKESSLGVRAFKQALASSPIYVISFDDIYVRLRKVAHTFYGQTPSARGFFVLANEVYGSVAIVSCASAAGADTVKISVPGNGTVTYTAVAYNATPSDNQWCVGHTTGADAESANNLAAVINNDATDANQGGKGDTNGNGGSTTTPSTLTAWASGGVCVVKCSLPGMMICSSNATRLSVVTDGTATVNIPRKAYPGLVIQFGSSGSTLTALTDSSGGATADGTIGAVTAPTSLTDNGGGTADGTVASQAAPVTLTDNTGDSGTHDDTIATIVAPVLSSSWDGATVFPSSAQGMAIETALGVIVQNESDLAQKVIELVTLGGVAKDNLKELTSRQAENRTAIVALTDAVTELATKINSLLSASSACPASGDAVKMEVTLENATRLP